MTAATDFEPIISKYAAPLNLVLSAQAARLTSTDRLYGVPYGTRLRSGLRTASVRFEDRSTRLESGLRTASVRFEDRSTRLGSRFGWIRFASGYSINI